MVLLQYFSTLYTDFFCFVCWSTVSFAQNLFVFDGARRRWRMCTIPCWQGGGNRKHKWYDPDLCSTEWTSGCLMLCFEDRCDKLLVSCQTFFHNCCNVFLCQNNVLQSCKTTVLDSWLPIGLSCWNGYGHRWCPPPFLPGALGCQRNPNWISKGNQPNSDGFQPKSDDLQPRENGICID